MQFPHAVQQGFYDIDTVGRGKMTEIERIRAALRISHTDADEEITQTIAAAKADMEAVGIRQQPEMDPLVMFCVELFCKAAFDFGGSKDWYQKRYRMLRDNMATMQKYQEGGGAGV